MPDDSLEILVKLTADTSGGKEVRKELEETGAATGKATEKTEESGKTAEKTGLSHRGLHLMLRQVGEASKGLEIGLMALTGVMMGSGTFAIYAVVTALQALMEHFKQSKEAAVESAKATVDFWMAAVTGKEDAIKAAKDYAEALHKIITNVDTLKQKESEEEAVLKAVLADRLKILEASRQAEIAAAKGDKEEEARINARYGGYKDDAELDAAQREIDLKKKQAAEQTADAMGKENKLNAAQAAQQKATAAGTPLSVVESKDALPKLEKTLQEAQSSVLPGAKREELEGFIKWWNGLNAVQRAEMPLQVAKATAATKMLSDDREARDTVETTKKEIENRKKVVNAYEANNAKLAKAVTDATAAFEKAVQTVRATEADIAKSQAVQRVNVDAANVIKGIRDKEIIQGAGAPDNPLSRSVVADIHAMQGLAEGHAMDAKQTEMINHLLSGLRAQGASQATINGLLLQMRDLHVDAQKTFEDIWRELRQLKAQHRDGFNQ